MSFFRQELQALIKRGTGYERWERRRFIKNKKEVGAESMILRVPCLYVCRSIPLSPFFSFFLFLFSFLSFQCPLAQRGNRSFLHRILGSTLTFALILHNDPAHERTLLACKGIETILATFNNLNIESPDSLSESLGAGLQWLIGRRGQGWKSIWKSLWTVYLTRRVE